MNVPRFAQVCVMIVLCATLLAPMGCGGAPKVTEITADSEITLEMSVRDETDSERLYKIDRSRTISFGGGFQARLGTTTWTGDLTMDDREQIANVINQQGWFASRIESTNEPKNRVYRIDLNGPPGHEKFKVVGHNDRVAPVEQVLERICLRRLDSELQKLPEPGLQRQ